MDTSGRKDTCKDPRLERCSLGACEPGEERWRRDEVATEPCPVAALLDDVELVAEFQGEVVARGGVEGVDGDCEGDAW